MKIICAIYIFECLDGQVFLVLYYPCSFHYNFISSGTWFVPCRYCDILSDYGVPPYHKVIDNFVIHKQGISSSRKYASLSRRYFWLSPPIGI